MRLDSAICKFLQSYRSTPSAVFEGKTPAELFIRHKLSNEISLVHPKGTQFKVGQSINTDYNGQVKYKANMALNFNKSQAECRLSKTSMLIN